MHLGYKHKQLRKRKAYGIGGDILDAVSSAASSVADTVKEGFNWLLGLETTRFKAFLKSHGEEEINSIKVIRVPISKAINLGMDLLTGGAFNKAKSKLSIDNFFHLAIVVNGKYIIEKNETTNYRSYSKAAGEESMDVPLKGSMTIDELIKNGSKGHEKQFWGEYSPLGNNCQAFIKGLLSRNGLNSPSINAFVMQDMESVIKELPSYTSHVGKTITDFASVLNRIIQASTGGAVGFKRGGIVNDGDMHSIRESVHRSARQTAHPKRVGFL
jgi:hypothetical protein